MSQSRDTDATLMYTLRAFQEKYGRDAVDTIAEGSDLAVGDTPAIGKEMDGKRIRSTADPDVPALQYRRARRRGIGGDDGVCLHARLCRPLAGNMAQ